MTNLEKTLQNHGLRKTAFRIELLDHFTKNQSSLSVDDIKRSVGSTNDKVTIYRALEAFEKCGLIHKVPAIDNLTRYALCHSECSGDAHVHNHAHFICNSCEETFCIEGIEIPAVKEVNGFEISNSKLTLEGKCPDCNSLQN